jgi:REase_MTES_1575
MAAVLAGGDGALLSHRAAAALWGIAATANARIDVTTVNSRRRNPRITFHHARRLDDDNRTMHEGVPVTTVARTLLDLAEVLKRRQLERALEEAERLRLLDLKALEDVCARNNGRRGIKPLRAALADLGPPPDTRSELERLFIDVCAEAGLPPPTLNRVVAGFEVDAVWPTSKLVVELDGYAFHRTRHAFERDRERDMALQLAGYRVLRVTHRRLARDADAVMKALRGAL